ncbi:MAG: hypothetical protein ACRDGT_05465 [Candidatus Limnocylindria bacterium]
MKHARALLPYALASVFVVVSSAVAIGASVVRDKPHDGPASAPAARAELSHAGRMSYWKEVDRDWKELWVSDLDGRRAWPVHREGAGTATGMTRWSPDGSRVAYVRANTSLVLVGLDGSRLMLVMPAPLVKAGWRIASYQLSPSAARIAFTLRPVRGASQESDVFVAEARQLPPWTRQTEIGGAVAGKWISETELFIESDSGMIAVADVTNLALRPITGLRAASPTLRPDGRVYFAGGGGVRNDLAGGPWANDAIWSATIDGNDLRREVAVETDYIRLQGRLADGRFVVGLPGSTYLVGDKLVPTPWRTGTIRRVIVSEDGREAIGVTDSRIVRLDPSKIPNTTDAAAPADATTILLDGVRDADVWFPASAIAPTRSPAGAASGPAARLAFTLGRTLWESAADGTPQARVSAPTQGWIGGVAWSPAGDRLAVEIGERGEWPNTTVAVLGRTGEIWRTPALSAPSSSWSSDGRWLVVSVYNDEGFGTRTTRLFEAATGAPGPVYEDVQARSTPSGLVLLDQGRKDDAVRHLVDQAVFLLRDGPRVRVTDARTLATHPTLRDVAPADMPVAISSVLPSADGRLLLITLYWINRATLGYSPGASAVVRVSDGEPVWAKPFDPLRGGMQDERWSPVAALLGRTVREAGPDGPEGAPLAQVLDPLSGRTVTEASGRFAGWSPEGDWVYVARDEGLYAYPLEGGERRARGWPGVRVNSFGVQVQATRP